MVVTVRISRPDGRGFAPDPLQAWATEIQSDTEILPRLELSCDLAGPSKSSAKHHLKDKRKNAAISARILVGSLGSKARSAWGASWAEVQEKRLRKVPTLTPLWACYFCCQKDVSSSSRHINHVISCHVISLSLRYYLFQKTCCYWNQPAQSKEVSLKKLFYQNLLVHLV